MQLIELLHKSSSGKCNEKVGISLELVNICLRLGLDPERTDKESHAVRATEA